MIATAAAIVAAWALLAWALWRPGWSALTWDDFTRIAIAQRWAGKPFMMSGIWLPLQTWVYGTAFALTGDLFAGNPMLLAALVNSAAATGAAALVGRAAWLVFGSAAGGLLAFAAVLFAPWTIFTALSALTESLYYLAVAVAVWALAARGAGGGLGSLAVGSLGVACASALRYEGWLLALAFIVMVSVTLLAGARPFSASTVARAWWEGRATLVVAAAPLLVPAAWMTLHALTHGSPLAFSAATSHAFMAAYGVELFGDVLSRLAYYPSGLARSAPLLLPLVVALAVAAARWVPRSRLLIGLVTVHFALFYLTSVVSRSVGAFTERFMFAFVLGLAPCLGMLPALLASVEWRPARVVAGVMVAALLLAETTHGLTHRPEEWTHAPDLLEVSTLLGDVARCRPGPLRVLLGEGLELDHMPLRIQNGRRVGLVRMPRGAGVDVPAADVRIERLPSRVRELPLAPTLVIGRYHLYGAVPAPRGGDALGTWRRLDEQGIATTVTPVRMVGLEFTGDDPPPRSRASVERAIPRLDRPQRGSLAVRWTYGHGFNLGRIAVLVQVDGREIFRTDIGTPSRWQRVTFEIPAGVGTSTVTVVTQAGQYVETGWKWGRASTVLVKELVLASEPAR